MRESNRVTRIEDKEKKKMKRRIIVQLFGKQKTDPRTEKNLEEFFNFIVPRKEFTGSEIVANTRMGSSAAYSLIEIMKKRHIIEKVSERVSAGRGKIDIFKLTNVGKLIASYVTDNTTLLTEALSNIEDMKSNPLMKFSMEAFTNNYGNEIMKQVLENSVRKALGMSGKIDLDMFISEGILDTNVLALLSKDTQLVKIARKNAELMESQNNQAAFLFLKMQIESTMLRKLSGDKLQKYIESLDQNHKMLHLPCENPNCNEVILVEKLTKLLEKAMPLYCGKCSRL